MNYKSRNEILEAFTRGEITSEEQRKLMDSFDEDNEKYQIAKSETIIKLEEKFEGLRTTQIIVAKDNLELFLSLFDTNVTGSQAEKNIRAYIALKTKLDDIKKEIKAKKDAKEEAKKEAKKDAVKVEKDKKEAIASIIEKGLFWYKFKEKYILDEEALLKFLISKNIYKISHDSNSPFIRIKDNLVSFIHSDNMIHLAIHNVKKDEDKKIIANSIGYQIELALNAVRLRIQLPLFDNDKVLKDTINDKYLFFKNRIVNIKKSGEIKYIDYKDASGFIWEDNIISRDIEVDQSKFGDFSKFISLISDEGDWHKSLECSLGYMMHSYKDPSKSKMVAIYEENYASSGGTGKSLLAASLKEVCGVVTKGGKTWDTNDRNFLDGVNESTNIFYIDDLKDGFKLETIYNLVTLGNDINGKYRPMFHLSYEQFPKILASSNYIISATTNSDKRRIHEVFINNYFSNVKQPIDIFKRNFWGPEWTDKDWSMFYNYMIHCTQQYFKYGLIEFTNKNLDARRKDEKQDEFIDLVNAIVDEAFNNTTDEVLYATPGDIAIAGQQIFKGDYRNLDKFKRMNRQISHDLKMSNLKLLPQKRYYPIIKALNVNYSAHNKLKGCVFEFIKSNS